MYLVRPDGYVAFRGEATSSEQLHDYLGRIFLPPPLDGPQLRLTLVAN